MIAVDTNVVVRFLAQDEPDQYQKSVHLFSTRSIFISDTVILETEWVLRYAYRFEPAEITAALRKLFGLPNVHCRDADAIAAVLSRHETGLDFADALHLAQAAHCEQLFTFDRKFASRSPTFSSCPVRLLDEIDFSDND